MSFDPLIPRPIDQPTEWRAGIPLEELDQAKIIAAPSDPALWPQWKEDLRRWRDDARRRLHYSDALYHKPTAHWAASCYAVAQVWLWDELLYSFTEHRFTPERLLEDAQRRFGGLDGVVLWHAYPVIGIDDANQWDYYRDVPGIQELVADLHARGARVFVDYNPWDTGTRRGRDDATELADLVRWLGADGIFLDTLKKADPTLLAALEEAQPGVVLEGESKLALERITDHAASWAQYFADSPVPGVLKAHWFERHHMQHHVRRWHRDHTEELHSAWLNGVGVMVWEVVFGVWVGWSARDVSLVRRMLAAQRALTEVLQDGAFEPLAELAGVNTRGPLYASRFTLGPREIWAVVNCSDSPQTIRPDVTGVEAFTGTSLPGTVGVPPRGIACVVVGPDSAEGSWARELHRVLPAWNSDPRFPHRVAVRMSSPQSQCPDPDADAVIVPSGDWVLTARFWRRESGTYQGAPFVDEWKPLPPRLHDSFTVQRSGTLPYPVAVARREVSVGEFRAFLDATGYQPAVEHRFLLGMDRWDDHQPVRYVDLDDARAYCSWRGGRLPTEDEWQLAAQSGNLQRRTPAVWNWTESEYTDGRSRFVMLKGGSDYRAEGSEWYFEGGRRDPEFTAKLLLPGLGLGRRATVGFRCAWEMR